MSLPDPPRPQGRYVSAIHEGELLLTAGMTPRVDGVMQYAGKVGRNVSIEDARRAAHLAASNALAAAVGRMGTPDRVRRVLRITVFVNAIEGFTEHSEVANGASEAVVELLGPRGEAVRSAIGVASLPGGACVEVELTCLV